KRASPADSGGFSTPERAHVPRRRSPELSYHSVAEVTHAGKDHGHPLFVSRRDHFFIAQAAAGLNDGGGPGPRADAEAVAEREVSVRGGHRPLGVEPEVARPQDRNLGRVHAAHLAGADADDAVAVGEDNGVRLDMLADPPGKV